MITRNPRWLLSLIVLFGSFFSSVATSLAEDVLRIGAIPDQNPERLNRLYSLLSTELSKELQIPVRYIAVTNYPAAVSAFRTNSLDLVWFGGLTGVQARLQKPGAKVLAQRDIDVNFRSVFIANTGSGIKQINSLNELSSLRGKRFTFGSESSTSGRLMPQYFLQEAGIKTTEFAGQAPGFSGSHDATLALVQSGSFEAGALNEQVWLSALQTGRADPQRVRLIWRTPAYADYHWLAQGNLDKRFGDGFTNRLKQALLSWDKKSKPQATILDLFGASRFIPALENQYKTIETIGRQLGKIQ